VWILQWLPDWTFYAITLIGIVGFLATYILRLIPIPTLYIYKTPIQLLSVALIVIGVFMSGAMYNEQAWQAKVNEMQIKVAEAEAKAAKENIKIVEKVVTKTQIVRVKGEEVVKYIDREIIKYDEKFKQGGQCEIPKEFYKALNDAAKEPEK
jgi:hypothetical protein